MKYNTYQELVDRIEELLNERQFILSQIPIRVLKILANKKISPRTYLFWERELKKR